MTIGNYLIFFKQEIERQYMLIRSEFQENALDHAHNKILFAKPFECSRQQRVVSVKERNKDFKGI